MKTKIFAMAAILMVVMSTIGVAIAQTEEDSTRKELKGKRLLHRYNVVFRQAEQSRIGMEAVIAYVDELGNDSAGLVEIKDNFVAKVGELKTAAEGNDFTGFKGAMEDIRGLIKEFKDESHSILGTDVGEARTRVAEAIQDNREYLDSLVTEINKARGELEEEAIDEAAEAAEEKVKKAKGQGADVTELQAKLDEIKEKREDLKTKIDAAIESCGDVGLGVCDTPEAQEYKALRQEIKDDFKALRDIARATGMKNKISKGIAAANKVLERANARLATAEERGVDVTAVKAKLDEVERLLDSAQEKLDAGDYEGATAELKAARTAFVSSMKEMKELRDSGSEKRGRGRGGEETDDEEVETEHEDEEQHEESEEQGHEEGEDEEHEEETSTEEHADESSEQTGEEDEGQPSEGEGHTENQTAGVPPSSGGGGGEQTEDQPAVASSGGGGGGE